MERAPFLQGQFRFLQQQPSQFSNSAAAFESNLLTASALAQWREFANTSAKPQLQSEANLENRRTVSQFATGLVAALSMEANKWD